MLYDDFLDISDVSEPNEEKTMIIQRNEINRIFQENKIKNRYPRYVDRNDLDVFTGYFEEIYRQLVIKNMSEIEKEGVKMIINKLFYHVINKYGELSKEYVDLINQ